MRKQNYSRFRDGGFTGFTGIVGVGVGVNTNTKTSTITNTDRLQKVRSL